jgi:hypothetical protein
MNLRSVHPFPTRRRHAPPAHALRLLLALAALGAAATACGDDASGPGAEYYGRLASNVSVSGVSVFQSVEVPLWTAGEERLDLNAVIADGKAATIVVYLEPAPEYDGRPLTVALGVDRGAGTRWMETSLTPTGPSSLARPESLAIFELPAEQVTGALSLAVAVLDPAAPPVLLGTPHAARYPADGSTRALTLSSARDPVRLVLVPIRYARDGTEYVPDTSPEQLELYRQTLLATYPAVAWDIVLHDEVYWDRPMGWGGFDFGSLNDHLLTLKATEGDVPQSHYYALVSPAASFATYCTPMCVAGQSYLVTDAAASGMRVGAGVGFTGPESAWTMVHELGHVFGRGHSGCSVPRDDRSFPYAGGQIGVWGRDPRDGTFRAPATADFMGYCTPQWVSDYTWNQLFVRLQELATLGAKRSSDRYRILRIDLDDGRAAWSAETLAAPLERSAAVPARFAGDDPLVPAALPIFWQSDFRHGAVLVPLERVAALRELPGLPAVPAP